MIRSWLGIVLLVLLLLMGIFTGIATKAQHTKTEQILDAAIEKAIHEEAEEAIALGKQAHRRWQKQRNITAMIADHTPMEDVDALFAQMEIYAQTGEIPHFTACCKELAARIAAVAEAHQFNLINIL